MMLNRAFHILYIHKRSRNKLISISSIFFLNSFHIPLHSAAAAFLEDSTLNVYFSFSLTLLFSPFTFFLFYGKNSNDHSYTKYKKNERRTTTKEIPRKTFGCQQGQSPPITSLQHVVVVLMKSCFFMSFSQLITFYNVRVLPSA